VAGTQRSQGPADRLQAEVFRRYARLGSYRVTELTDVPHELNGLLTSPTTRCWGCRRRADRITAAFRERSLEVIEAARVVTGHPIPRLDTPRRAGDPPILVAFSHLMANELGWAPEKLELTTMIADAWAWMRASAVENAEWLS